MLVVRLLAAISSVAVTAAACGGPPKMPAEPPTTESEAHVEDEFDGGDAAVAPVETLYERLGKKAGIERIVAALFVEIEHDPALRRSFSKIRGKRRKRLEERLVDRLCTVSGGDCVDGGAGAESRRVRYRLTHAQWEALMADFEHALDSEQVPAADRADLVTLVGSLEEEIVSRPDKK